MHFNTKILYIYLKKTGSLKHFLITLLFMYFRMLPFTSENRRFVSILKASHMSRICIFQQYYNCVYRFPSKLGMPRIPLFCYFRQSRPLKDLKWDVPLEQLTKDFSFLYTFCEFIKGFNSLQHGYSSANWKLNRIFLPTISLGFSFITSIEAMHTAFAAK